VTKLLSLAAAIGVSLFCVAATSAMPLALLDQTQASLTIPVAGGCGLGFHRGRMANAVATATTAARTTAASAARTTAVL
jgi:hypothetical protein